jgi:hypothetical protein
VSMNSCVTHSRISLITENKFSNVINFKMFVVSDPSSSGTRTWRISWVVLAGFCRLTPNQTHQLVMMPSQNI